MCQPRHVPGRELSVLQLVSDGVMGMDAVPYLRAVITCWAGMAVRSSHLCARTILQLSSPLHPHFSQKD